jgi:diadenosine tetraphosphatase ApaH/serine/threonine PP2A family protein phosphatase
LTRLVQLSILTYSNEGVRRGSLKIALLSDLHANIHALDACLEHANTRGAERYALLGDLVGYGAFPSKVIDRCMVLEQSGAIVIRGNHESLALKPQIGVGTWGGLTAQWTHDQLSVAQKTWIAALPLEHRLGPLWMVHASANEPGLWHYVRDAEAASRSLSGVSFDPTIRWIFSGHVHDQALYVETHRKQTIHFQPEPGVEVHLIGDRRHLGIVGSLGQPRDGDPRACYALLDVSSATLVFWRVRYDHVAAADAVRRAGLPEMLAQRLELGR